jgi:hypothetical protein
LPAALAPLSPSLLLVDMEVDRSNRMPTVNPAWHVACTRLFACETASVPLVIHRSSVGVVAELSGAPVVVWAGMPVSDGSVIVPLPVRAGVRKT